MGDVFSPTRTVVSVGRFQRMVGAGVWRDDERIELIEGEILDMAPIGGAHAWAVTRLADLLRRAVGDRALVWIRMPVVLGQRSQPQPDLALIRTKPGGYGSALPLAEDVALVVEVSDTTAAYDRTTKLALYARHAIPEYWLVDVRSNQVEGMRMPQGSAYTEIRVFAGDDRLAPPGAESAGIRAADIFG